MKNKREAQRVIIIAQRVVAIRPSLARFQVDMWKQQPLREELQPLPTQSVHKGSGATNGGKEMGSVSHSPGPKEWRAPCNTQAPPYQPKAEARLAGPKARS